MNMESDVECLMESKVNETNKQPVDGHYYE